MLAAALAALVQVNVRADSPVDPAAIKHWQDIRFGMFIHWGPVSLTGHEIGWSRGAQTPIEKYDSLYKEFNPTNFNADEWVGIAKAAGMKYMVLTTKHHDGFCLWDTKLTDYNIMHTPFKRDVVRELADACKKQGMEFGTYYSVTDWYDRNWPVTSPAGKVKRDTFDLDAYEKYLQGQITELITGYGPLITIWNDVPAMYGKERGQRTIDLVRRLQPNITINNRTGAGGDYNTPEQKIGGFDMDRPWESCMTISAHNAWAWGGEKDGVKPLQKCIAMLANCAGGDGNVLLNVGPRPDGRIDEAQANRLREVGVWMKKNGESIYATRGGPFKPAKDFSSTRKGSTIYLHFMGNRREVKLPAIPLAIKSAKALCGADVRLKDEPDGGKTVVIEGAGLDDVDAVVALETAGDAMSLAPVAVDGGGGGPAGKAHASAVFGSSYSAAMAVDGDPETRWATPGGTHSAWIEIELPAPAKISSAMVEQEEAYATRIEAYEFQCEENGAWKILCAGGSLGVKGRLIFEPVTAQKFRLNITKANEGPTISEIVLK
jgi:alpha-L-fucosidase